MSYRRMETTSKDAEWKQGQGSTGDTQDGIEMSNLDNRSLKAISILLFDCACGCQVNSARLLPNDRGTWESYEPRRYFTNVCQGGNHE